MNTPIQCFIKNNIYPKAVIFPNNLQLGDSCQRGKRSFLKQDGCFPNTPNIRAYYIKFGRTSIVPS